MTHLRALLLATCAVTTIASAQTTPKKKTAPGKLPPAPPGVVIEQNVAYLPPDRQEKLDLYLPADRGKDVRSPAILIIHGGGWTSGDKAASREFNIGTNLAKAGYVCASVDYMMEEGKRWPTNLFDCKNAVRFLRKNAEKYQIDVDRFGVIGGSAGGHLSLMVGYTSNVKELEPEDLYPGVSDRVSAVVDLYGISDLFTLTEHGGTGQARPRVALFKQTREEAPELWKLASPVYHISSKTPPTLILHGTQDTTVDIGQSKELDQKLNEQGVEHQLVIVEGAGHTFDLQTWSRKPLSQDLRPVVIGFFDKHVKGTGKP